MRAVTLLSRVCDKWSLSFRSARSSPSLESVCREETITRIANSQFDNEVRRRRTKGRSVVACDRDLLFTLFYSLFVSVFI